MWNQWKIFMDENMWKYIFEFLSTKFQECLNEVKIISSELIKWNQTLFQEKRKENEKLQCSNRQISQAQKKIFIIHILQTYRRKTFKVKKLASSRTKPQLRTFKNVQPITHFLHTVNTINFQIWQWVIEDEITIVFKKNVRKRNLLVNISTCI